jgi:uncharacterized membrane protein affecting hemolysin expression
MRDLTPEEQAQVDEFAANLRRTRLQRAFAAQEAKEREATARTQAEQAQVSAARLADEKYYNKERLREFLEKLQALREEYDASIYGGEGVTVSVGRGEARAEEWLS